MNNVSSGHAFEFRLAEQLQAVIQARLTEERTLKIAQQNFLSCYKVEQAKIRKAAYRAVLLL